MSNLLRQRQSTQEIQSLHRSASRWYHKEGFLEDALDHALAAQDFERAAAMTETHIVTLFSRSEVPVLLGWIEKLPGDVLHTHPWIDVYRANTLALTGRADEAVVLLDQVEQRISAESPNRAELLGHIAAVRAYTANLHGDAARYIEMAALTARHLPDKYLTAHGMAALARSDAYIAGDDLESASIALQEMLKAGENTGQIMLGVTALCDLATIKKVQGNLHQAEELYRRAFRWMEAQNGLNSRVRCTYEFGLADLLREWNQLDEAYRHALIGDEIRKRLGGYLVVGDLVLLRILLAKGDFEAALEARNAAERSIQPNQFHMTTNIDYLTTLIGHSLAVEDVKAAGRLAQDCHGVSDLEQIARARLLLAREQSLEALDILGELSRLVEAGGRFGRMIEILCLQALAFKALGRRDGAMLALARALSLARPAGYVRVFLDCGPPMMPLLESTLRQGRDVPALDDRYGKNVLAAFQDELAKVRHAEALPYNLTAREVEVLHLLAEGISNREIAERLIVAPSTVKEHLKHIYGKLDVHSRTQAVARGREVGLL